MAKSPLILAALANDAVPNIHFVDVKTLSSGAIGAFDSAILTTADNEHAVIRIANTPAAGTEQEVELRALAALETVRDQLPFKMTRLLGATADQRGARALVFDFIYGGTIDVPRLAPEGHLAESIGKAIASIHNLPASLVQEAHLPEYEPSQTVRARVADLDRAAATGRVPAVLLARWENALEDSELFRYQPTVIHGSLSGDSVLELDNEVCGVLNWAGLRIGDPAEDFAWIFGAAVPELTDTVLMSYSISRSLSDATLRQRAALYSELEMARWLVHGVAQKDQEIIDDALGMLDGLVEELASGSLRPLTATAAAAAAIAAQSAFIAASEAQEQSAFLSDATQEIAIVTEEVDSVTEEVEIVADEADEVVELEPDEAEEPEVSAGDNTKTRVIELPEKGENELF